MSYTPQYTFPLVSEYMDDQHLGQDDDASVYSFASYDDMPADDVSLIPYQQLTSYKGDKRAFFRSYRDDSDLTEDMSPAETKEFFYPSTITGPSGSGHFGSSNRASLFDSRLPTYPPGGMELSHMELLSFRMFVRHMEEDRDLIPETTLQRDSFEQNMTVGQFIKQWFLQARPCTRRNCPSSRGPFGNISQEAVNIESWYRPEKLSRPNDCHHKRQIYDIQGIPWSRLNIHRQHARLVRSMLYRSFRNQFGEDRPCCQTLPWDETYFHPKTMYNKYRGSMGHFQLRNLMSVTASNTVQYVSKDKVYSTIPFYNEHNCILDLQEEWPEASSHRPLLISTMKAKHGITAVGDVGGEFAMKSDDAGVIARRQLGDNQEMITHVDVVESRATHSPQVVVCSNDQCVRTIDCDTDQIIQTFKFARAVNCSDGSPDGRMRVMIGDAPEAWVIDSDTGKAIRNLNHHNDFGFACAWSPDMLHIATSNQDKTVNVWDTRMWRLLTSINADVACYRSLRYSPVGGGPRTLLMCEPADHVSLVNAQTYQTRQAIDFFGEIGGADFTPDGGRLWISNLDPTFGGLMEYERCQWGHESGLGHLRRGALEEGDDAYFTDKPSEWVDEAYLSEDVRCVLNTGERRLRYRRLLPEKGFSPAWRVLTARKR